MPAIPTDNLYKFITLLGISMILSGAAIASFTFDRVDSRLSDLVQTVSAFKDSPLPNVDEDGQK